MDYSKSLDYLMNQLPVYQKAGKKAYKADLKNALSLDHHFSHPHTHFSSIHVAGTNGKGSVSHMLASVFQESGYKTGLFTSPHLIDFRERIRVNGKLISKSFISDFVSDHKPFFNQLSPSFFEISVFLAFEYFKEQKVDIAIIETGLGGRLDTTNIIHPLASIITNIGIDHSDILGNTLPDIAREKAGIIKSETPVILGKTQKETLPIFTCESALKNSPIYVADKRFQVTLSSASDTEFSFYNIAGHDNADIEKQVSCDLQGVCQTENIGTTLQSIEIIREKGYKIKDASIQKGLRYVCKNTGLQGRWQTLSKYPTIICDVAHNKDGLLGVFSSIDQLRRKQKHLVLGFVNDKDISTIWELIDPTWKIYLSEPSVERKMPVKLLAEKAKEHNINISGCYSSVSEAYEMALAACSPEDILFVGGSCFVVSDLLYYLQNQKEGSIAK